jgi:hypothetical protein
VCASKRAFLELEFVQHAGLTAYLWLPWSQSQAAWRHGIVIISIQSFSLGIWLVTVIGCYLYWRSEKSGFREVTNRRRW